jgi:hypothetical protein
MGIVGLHDLLMKHLPPSVLVLVGGFLAEIAKTTIAARNPIFGHALGLFLDHSSVGLEEYFQRKKAEGKDPDPNETHSILMGSVEKFKILFTSPSGPPRDPPSKFLETLSHRELTLLAALIKAVRAEMIGDPVVVKPDDEDEDDEESSVLSRAWGRLKTNVLWLLWIDEDVDEDEPEATLAGNAFRIEEAIRHLIREDPRTLKHLLKALVKDGVTPEMVAENPAKHGEVFYNLVATLHNPGPLSWGGDIADALNIKRATLEWLDRRVIFYATVVIVALAFVIAGSTFLVSGTLGLLGAFAWLFGLVVGMFFAPESALAGVPIMIGLGLIYVARLLFPAPSHLSRGAANLVGGTKVGQNSPIEEGAARIKNVLRILGIGSGEQIVRTLLALDDSHDIRNTGWWHHVAVAVSIVTAGLTAIVLGIFLVMGEWRLLLDYDAGLQQYTPHFYRAAWLFLTRTACFVICFAAIGNDIVSRTSWRFTFTQSTARTALAIKLVVAAAVFAAALFVCGGGIGLAGVGLHVAYGAARTEATQVYHDFQGKSSAHPEDDAHNSPYDGCTEFPCKPENKGLR